MLGLELLVIDKVFKVQTAYGPILNLKFMGFIKENDDVTLAVFSTTELRQLYFDISVTSNQVII